MLQDGYHCNGNISEWEPCDVITQSPKVTAFKIPSEVEGVKKRKRKPMARVFALPEGATRPASDDAGASAAATAAAPIAAAAAAVAPSGPAAPLANVTVATAGRLSQSAAQVKKRITDLGGTVHTGPLGVRVTCVIGTAAEVREKAREDGVVV